MSELNPTIVLPGHGKPTTVKSVIRDANFLKVVWHQVKEGYDAGKKEDEILSKISTTLRTKYKPLYKNFDAAIKQQVQAMYNKQKV